MRGVERVFHAAGTTNLRMPQTADVLTRRGGNEDRARGGAAGPGERAVYTSSVAAIGPAQTGRTANEGNVWEAGRYAIPYVDAKHEAEIAALRLVGRGLPLVIVNPAHVLGAGDPGRSSTVTRAPLPASADPRVR